MTDRQDDGAASARPARKRGLLILGGVVLLGAAAWGVHHWQVARHFENTDNAYVQANVVQITPQVGGTVLAIQADDTDYVKAGQPLVKLDPADARVALDRAEAQLAQTVREVRTLFSNNAALKAQVALRDADVARARSDLQRAQDDVERRRPLLATGAVGQEEFNHAQSQLAAVRSAVAAAESARVAAAEQLAANVALTDGSAVQDHPNVQRAAAQVREAFLAARRTELLAPVDGYVARRSVQLGQRVQAGAPLMSVVSLGDTWVDANFKEGQLRKLRIGQPATLEADVYGSKVEYHGTVVGLGAGTGAAFSLLPAQNATGNWIKVVQRVPVRIALDPKEVQAHPLRVGLSMDVTVDVTQQDGKVLADGGKAPTQVQTQVYDDIDARADEEVRRIVSAQLGKRVAGTPAARLASVTPATPAGVAAH